MVERCWNYPVILASVGTGQRPGRAALRALVRRMRQEAFPDDSQPAQQRLRMRRALSLIFLPDYTAVRAPDQ